MRKALPLLIALGGILLLASGCAVVNQATEGLTAAAAASGAITSDQAGSINRSVSAVVKTFEDITPEQEYWIGRTVAATILKMYKPYDNAAANEYLNDVGQSVALASERPETFNGYHFLIMDTDDINAFAAPGGLILVSRGMLRCCRSEDAVAAVLAHEVGHVAHKHGLKAIEKGRVSSAATTLAAEAGKNLGGKELAELTRTFEGAITDITSTMINNGYARNLESEADKAAVMTLKAIGYDPGALVSMLGEMEKRLKPGGRDFAKTHPDPKDRIKEVRGLIGAWQTAPAPAARQARFEKALKSI
jgi:beta-barrel assembly-enhancing protease